MTWLIDDVIIQARQIVQDEQRRDVNGAKLGSPRHSDEKLIGYFNNAMSEVRRLRPDAFIGDDEAGSLTIARDFAETSSIDDPFPLEEQFFSAFVLYVAGMVGIGDDEYAQDGRAVGLMNNFKMQLVGRNATS